MAPTTGLLLDALWTYWQGLLSANECMLPTVLLEAAMDDWQAHAQKQVSIMVRLVMTNVDWPESTCSNVPHGHRVDCLRCCVNQLLQSPAACALGFHGDWN